MPDLPTAIAIAVPIVVAIVTVGTFLARQNGRLTTLEIKHDSCRDEVSRNIEEMKHTQGEMWTKINENGKMLTAVKAQTARIEGVLTGRMDTER